MSIIDVQNLTFSYEGSYDNIFENTSFQLDTDWKLGFIGRNGRGKTTFLNLLLGKYEYSGRISSSVIFQYFPYSITDKTISVRKAAEEICPLFKEWELMKELSLLDVGEDILDRSFETLSNGEQTKVLLAALFLSENNFLLIDEPTNHLDLNGREIVSNYLNGKSGFILVSHDRAFLDKCVDHVLSINRANIEVQRGNFATWHANRKRQDSFELAENEKLKKDIKRLKQAAKQSEKWADKVEATKIGKRDTGIEWAMDSRAYIGEKSKRMQQRRKNLERRQQKAIDDKSSLLKNIEKADELKLSFLSHHSSPYIECKDISINYGEKTIFQGISFKLEKGDRLAIRGANGSGKTSLIKLLIGEEIKYSGYFQKSAGLKISYVNQQTSHLTGSLEDFILSSCVKESLFKSALRKLGFERTQFDKYIQDYSAGQKKKLLIAKSLCDQSHVYIWDEPLNYIDIISRMQIEELLLSYKPTLIFVEHDMEFNENIATKVLEL